VDAWEKLAELCGQYLRKGRTVLVEGRLQMDSWERDGVKHQKLKIRAMTVKFMPLPAPNQSRLTGEPIVSGGNSSAQPPVVPQSGDMDGYDDDDSMPY
jgi:single-strand DNA-binding protein